MHVLHVVPNLHLCDPQIAVLEFCRVSRMRGVRTSVLATSDEGTLAGTLLEAQLVGYEVLSNLGEHILRMHVLQESIDVVHTHTAADFDRIFPAVSGTTVRLVHTSHLRTSFPPKPPLQGSAHRDQVTWVRGSAESGPAEDAGFDGSTTILDGVWSPPFDTLRPDRQRRALEVEPGQFVIGVDGAHDLDDVIAAMRAVTAKLDADGVDARVVVFGTDQDAVAPDGYVFVSREDPELLDRLEALDVFVQLEGRDFSQLALLGLARRIPVILPRPESTEMFRGGWSPCRFERGDTDGLASQLMRYASNPEMHQVHRSLVRDYVLTFRDSMSMVGEYARLYSRQHAMCATGE